MSDLVGTPEDRFSHNEAQIIKFPFRDWNAADTFSFKCVFFECGKAADTKRAFRLNNRITLLPWWNDSLREAYTKLKEEKRNFKWRSSKRIRTKMKISERRRLTYYLKDKKP